MVDGKKWLPFEGWPLNFHQFDDEGKTQYYMTIEVKTITILWYFFFTFFFKFLRYGVEGNLSYLYWGTLKWPSTPVSMASHEFQIVFIEYLEHVISIKFK